MALLLTSFGVSISAQETGAAALANALAFLRPDVPRVLYIAAHPDDEDTRLITWLQRGGYAEVAYLSLSRGEGGQNAIGNELGDALGVLRTQELLAARRVDGAAQFFTRAYDFGYSKTAEEAFSHWPRDSLLRDMVKIVRAYRPHVLVSTFSGTPRDGHGQHQVAGILTRDVFDAAADTVRFPRAAFGAAWQPLKLYRLARFAGAVTVAVNVGEYDPLGGRSYAEIASDSRSHHRSQAYRRNARLGVVPDSLQREVTLVSAGTPANQERSLLDGIPGATRDAWMLSAGTNGAGVAAVDFRRPQTALAVIARYAPRTEAERRRHDRAALIAAGLAFEALPARPYVAVGDTVTVTYHLHNRGSVAVRIDSAAHGFPREWVEPGATATWNAVYRGEGPVQPWWLAAGRRGDLYAVPVSTEPEAERDTPAPARAAVSIAGLSRPAAISARYVHRFSETPYGDVLTPLVVAPGVTVTPVREIWYARAGTVLEREVSVRVRSSFASEKRVAVRVRLPAGLTAQPREQTVDIEGGGSRVVTFRLRGTLAPGEHTIGLEAEADGERFASAVQTIEYEHIIPQRLYRPADIRVSAVEVAVPAGLAVGYVAGSADEGPHVLEELGVPLTRLTAAELPRTDLSKFTTIVIGPRAYEVFPELIEQNQRLFEFARAGGRLVVQHGQYPMENPGVLPYRITISRPPNRVTDERASVTFTDPRARELTYPNRISAADFAGWVQERATFMPREFDPQYRTFLAMHDPGEDPLHSAVLVAPLGRGTYVYVTLALFRQFSDGVPGAARIFVNLLTPPGR